MIVFVAGIDTGVGKTAATGMMARYLAERGRTVITQKLAQTGCDEQSEDIVAHRRLMGCGLLPEDRQGLTCPYCFRYPASPHLAAALEGRAIDIEVIRRATETLGAAFDWVVVEGVGGLCVPLTDDMTVLDHIAAQRYPVVLVTSPVLGSINHTLLSLEALQRRAVPVLGLVYNRAFEADPVIAEDSRRVFRRALARRGYPDRIVDLPRIAAGAIPDIDFGPLFA